MSTPSRSASPLLIDVHELRRKPGTSHHIEKSVPAPADLSLPLIGVPEGSNLALDLTVDAILEGVYVNGQVAAHLRGECSRCLIDIERDLEVPLKAVFAEGGERGTESADDEEVDLDAEETGAYPLDDDWADLEPLVRDEIVSALPFRPLCRPDCPGLCPVCGVRLEEHPGHTHEAPIDPRWAALRAALDDAGGDTSGHAGDGDAGHDSASDHPDEA